MKIKRITYSILIIIFLLLLIPTIFRNDLPILSHSLQIETFTEDAIESDYQLYINNNQKSFPNDVYVLNTNSLDQTLGYGYEIISGEAFNKNENLIFSDEVSEIQFVVYITTPGYFNLSLSYFPIEGKSSSIERSVKINSEIPYKAASRISFPRIWISETKNFKIDNNGNDIIPRQVEAPRWNQRNFIDADGLIQGDLYFYFQEGQNIITIGALKEPVIIEKIELLQSDNILTYQQYLDVHKDNENLVDSLDKIIVQGQDMKEKSSPTLYPTSDRTSPVTFLQDNYSTRINTGGGYNWRIVGDWISYDIDVPKDGFYQISFRAKQSYIRGAFVTRQMRINGKVPFEEMNKIPFVYSGNFEIYTLGKNEPYEFYFEKGKHEISFEVVLGDFNDSIREVTEVINNLNRLYREIIMITTAQPDRYRDYQLKTRLPNLLNEFSNTEKVLKRISRTLFEISGESSSRTVILDKVALQLADFIAQPETIHQRLSEYINNISALGSWILEIKEQPLLIDYFVLHGSEYEFKNINGNVWQRLSFSFHKFVASFVIDYNSLNSSSTNQVEKGNITVWMGSGRDQANILRRLIDEDFTEKTGIGVNLQLVSMDVLLPSTLTRSGPDVAIGVGNQIPVNFAMRNAVYDISTFSDFNEVSKRFQQSALTPYTYLDGVYALPETQVFPVMFYRKDILDELNIKIPETWEDVISIIPELQRRNLDFFLPIDIVEAVRGVLPPNLMYVTLLYQNGGQLYINNDRETGLQERVALDAFKQWTDFYTNYRFQVQANFVNRFRSGEMPIGISYYNMYNTLTVFAPEISGNWGFTTVPGIRQEDGSINNVVPSTGTGILLMNQSKEKELSWEFMKWWTEDNTQVRFGREMEGILGAAARYPTANINALERLPWPAKDLIILKKQWENTIGIPEVPGGYFTGRHLDNALRNVIIKGANPRDTLYAYAEIMNNEITSKRREFGLD
jgi:ABC-type glycerol-3-phosphate transport system substrate-binding protein